MKSDLPFSKRKWSLLGAGSMGCLWASQLVQAGFEVDFILRTPTRAKQLTEAGHHVSVLSQWQGAQNWMNYPVGHSLTTDLSPIDYLLVCTKAYDSVKAVKSILPRITDETLVFVLQNGMGFQQRIEALLPRNAVFCLSSTDGAYLKEPFQVVHAGIGQTVVGSLSLDDECAQQLLDPILQTGLTMEHVPNIHQRLWQKVAINAVINPLTALYLCRNGEVLEQDGAPHMMTLLCEETAEVMTASGIPTQAKTLTRLCTQVMEQTAENFSSMNRDIQRGKKTEIDAINGYIIEMGQRLSIPTSTHQHLFTAVKNLEEKIFTL